MLTKLDNIDLNVYEAGMSRVGGNSNSSGGSSLQGKNNHFSSSFLEIICFCLNNYLFSTDMMNMITDLRE